MVNGKCECGGQYLSPLFRVDASFVLKALTGAPPDAFSCPACGVIHVRVPGAGGNFRRHEFDGAKGEWLPTPE